MIPPTGSTPAARTPPRSPGRHALRALAFAWVALVGLAACSGGSGTPGDPPAGAPTILEFGADQTAYAIGETATLTVRFSGGTGRIEPGVGAVASGAAVRVGPLDGTRDLDLVVTSAAGTATRRLRLPVAYRDRYRALAATFASRGHSATLADDGRVVIVGGSRGGTTLSDSVDAYDPRTGAFRRIGAVAQGREGHRATRLPDGRILVTGGVTALGRATAELVDERTGAAAPTGAPGVARVGHTATYLGGGRVLVLGGVTPGAGAAFGISDGAEIWEARTGAFRPVAARLAMRRAWHSAMQLPDGRVLILGGLTSPGTPYRLAETFDPATETFTTVPAVDDRERGLHATAQLADGSVVMLGGETSATAAVRSVLRFDRATAASSTLANLLRPRTMAEAVPAYDGRIFLFGGEVGTAPAPTETAEAYSVATGPQAIASLPGPRVGHTATRLHDGRILIVGGEDGRALVPTALLYE